MFVVEIGSVLTTLIAIRDVVAPTAESAPLWFTASISFWLWFTVVFANLAEAVAEGRGKAQAGSLRKMRTQTTARRLPPEGKGPEEVVGADSLRTGDVVVVEAGEMIPGDGEVIDGVASVDESAITGESAPVIRESGGDRSAVTGGTRVLSDRIIVRITANPGQTFLDRMIALVEGASRQKTPNEIALHILLVGMTIVFLLACVTLVPLAAYSSIATFGHGDRRAAGLPDSDHHRRLALRHRHRRHGPPDPQERHRHERPRHRGGRRRRHPAARQDRHHHARQSHGHGIHPGGRQQRRALSQTPPSSPASPTRPRKGARSSCWPRRSSACAAATWNELGAEFVKFSALTRMSGCDFDGRKIRKGAVDAIKSWVEAQGGQVPAELRGARPRHRRSRARHRWPWPRAGRVLGLVRLNDVVKGGIAERFARFRAMGIRTVMITGDNPRTAAAIAREAGVDDFLAEATPEAKMRLIKAEQAKGKLVAMTGDGTNDAPALAQADVGVAMNSGTQAAKEAGNMIDLESNPTKLLGGGRGRQAAAHDPRRADHVFHRQRRGQVLRHPARHVHGRPSPRSRRST